MLCLVKRGEEICDGEIERERAAAGGGWRREWDEEGSGVEGRREVERGKSSARSTIFPSRRAVTFYLASFGECSDWSVEKEISFFLRGEKVAPARAHTSYFSRAAFSQPPRKDISSAKLLCEYERDNDRKTEKNLSRS